MTSYNLFEKSVADSYISRIEKLSKDTRPKWGQMNAAQMCAHCAVTFEVALGEIKQSVNPIVKLLFKNMIRKQVLGDKDIQKNAPTYKESKINFEVDLEKEKKRLIEDIQKFQSGGISKLIKVHPMFGKLNEAEWQKVVGKHLDYHLNQFEV